MGTSAWTVAALAVPFSAGFAAVNTPLAAVVSLIVDRKDLASALSLNTMMFFIGGSFGATFFSSIVINTAIDADALNPLHDNPGAGFSNAFRGSRHPRRHRTRPQHLSAPQARRRETRARRRGLRSVDTQLPAAVDTRTRACVR